MQNWILPLTTLLVCALSFFLLLRDREMHPVREGVTPEPEALKKDRQYMLIYAASAVVVLLVLSLCLPGMLPGNTVFDNLKRMLLLAVIWPVAYIDYKTYRIPNAFVLMGLAVRVVLLPFEFLADARRAMYMLISEVVAAGALFAAAMLCSVCAKGSIGFGDIKLFVVLGLYLGTTGSWGAIFTALLVSLATVLFLMATKRKGRKDSIPFGPAIVIGTFISVCLTGM